MKESDWDQRIWRMATNPWILAVTAILQGKTLYDMVRNSGESIEMLIARWALPLGISVLLAAVVVFFGMRNFWSLTRMVLVGFAVVMVAQPLINAYVSVVLQGS